MCFMCILKPEADNFPGLKIQSQTEVKTCMSS